MPREGATSPQAVTLPKGGADVRGLGGGFVPDYNRGTGSYSLDLQLPPGLAGFAPHLALAYNSGGSGGAFGLGWSLTLPQIRRDGEAGFLRYDDSDPIQFDEHGELTRLPDGSYRPRVDRLFARILRTDTGGWQVRDRQGTTRSFGLSTYSRICDPDDPARVLAWALEEEEDLNGNRITYHYLQDGNNLYLSEIRYAVYRIRLEYEARPDVRRSARHGFPIETRLRCHRIELHCERVAPATLIRTYELAYRTPDEVPLSLLEHITLTGHRTTGKREETTSHPPLSFSYSALSPHPNLRPFDAAAPVQPPSLGVAGTELLDVTGDGVADVVQLEGIQARYWRNRGDGSWDAPKTFQDAPSDVRLSTASVTFADMDGDGSVDLLVSDGLHSGWYPKLPGGGWGGFHRYDPAPAFDLKDRDTRQVDLDGDGAVDLLRTETTRFVVLLNEDGRTWSAPSYVPRNHDLDVFPDVHFADPGVHLADMTGDGLSDIVLVRSGSVWYWPYEGLDRSGKRPHWGKRRVMASPPVFDHDVDPERIFFADVNGDGVTDLVHVGQDVVTVWFNRLGTGFSSPVRIPHTPTPSGADVRTADLFGSGVTGVLWSYASTHPAGRYVALDLCGEQKPYLLTGIDNGLGCRTDIRYQTSTQYAVLDRSRGRPWATFLPFPVQVVAEVCQHDSGTGTRTQTRVSYHDGMYDGRERRFAGFGEVDVEEVGDTDAPGLLTTARFDQTPTHGLTGDERMLALARQGSLLETLQRETGTGTVLRRSRNTWDAQVATRGVDGGAVVVLHRTASETEAHGGDEGPLVESHRLSYDTSGNITRQELCANGPTPLTKIIDIEYARLGDGHDLSCPARVREACSDGVLVREMRMYYDGAAFTGLPLGQATHGNIARHSIRVLSRERFVAHYGAQGYTATELGYREEDGAVWSDTLRLAHDSRGRVIESRNSLDAPAALAYDMDGVFPTSCTDAAGHTSTFTWDDAALQPCRAQDQNGAVTEFGFDPLGRVVAIALPGDTLDDPSETVEYHLETAPATVDLHKRVGPQAVSHRRMTFTGTGDTLQSRTRVDASTVAVSPERSYNARGWLAEEGVASYAATMTPSPSAVPGAESSQIRYDALGRIAEVHYADGRHDRTVFDAFRTVHYDANDTDPAMRSHGFFDTPRIHRNDGWGRITGVTELHDGTLTTHGYDYDEMGRLTAVRGPDGAPILHQAYDQAGNRLELEHRDAGTRRFYWNAAGRLIRVVDGMGDVIERTYDALDRPTRVLVNGTVIQTMAYDDPARPNSNGRLSSAQDETGRWEFDYDARGRLERRTLHEAGRSWSLEYTYNAADAVERIRYPDGSEVRYEYDQAGRVRRIPGYLDGVGYDPRGQRTYCRYANGVSTFLDYDVRTAFLRRLRVLAPDDTKLADLTYQRDNVGNLLRLDDGRPPGPGAPHSREFHLDGRYRLLRVEGGSPNGGVPPYTRDYAYDPASNVTRHPAHPGSDVWFEPAGSNLIAGFTAKGIAQRAFRHDGNGNIVRMPGRALSFNALGQLTEVTDDTGRTVSYAYSVAGERVWRTSTSAGKSTRTLSLAGVYEEDDDGTVRRYIHDNRTPVAREDPSGRLYLHSNDLGHLTLVTDTAGTPVGQRTYHPFGEAAIALGPAEPRGFGGRLLDDVSGLYCFGARYYAPEIGRFVSPDPLVLMHPEMGTANPQLHNLYAYCGNNPMTYVDPRGLSLWGAIFGGFAGGLIGAAVFVASGGNILLAGLVGGLAGGAISGAIDGGVKGAVIGGCFGALTGLAGGAALWGASALGGLIWGHVGQQIATGALGAAMTYASLPSIVGPLLHGNWDAVAYTAAGLIGSFIGNSIANAAMMKGVFPNPQNSPRVREVAKAAQSRLDNRYNFDQVKYQLGSNPDALASHHDHVITFSQENSNGSYLDFRRTLAHELRHEAQLQDMPNFETPDVGEWAQSVAKYGDGEVKNPFQAQAENFAMEFTNYTPYWYGSSGYVFNYFPMSTVVSNSLRPAAEYRRRVEEA
ncbi:toxin TcdB middle/N-terminal domain-containing protein [Streptomyces sp. NPDC056002]|uniref:toxin TcdB middle/N-terminal domain-containing protein n=1 Tax=Streptomyces sp. NPDC056002 TaxID=3345675 RepID=UPI0035D8BA77